ncbi:MAG: T9SS type A sorting domain-containing protein [candidate division FCPU426 bacterium]
MMMKIYLRQLGIIIKRMALGAVTLGLAGTAPCFAAELLRSVGYGNVDPLRDGATPPAITMRIISSAQFSADLPLNIGVGDCIIYDSGTDHVYDSVAFIYQRLDARNYQVCDAAGQDPVTTTGYIQDWRIYRAYASLADAARGLENPGMSGFSGWNFDNHMASFAMTDSWSFACYADAPNTNTADFSAWMTAIPQNRLKIFVPAITTSGGEVGVSQRHNGVWSASAFVFVVGNSTGLNVMRNTTIEGLQFQNTGGTANIAAVYGAFITDSDVRITKCIFRGPGGSTDAVLHALDFGNMNAGEVKIWNNIFYDYKTIAEGNAAIYATSTAAGFLIHCYHNTIVNCESGINAANQAVAYAKNCMVLDIDLALGASYSGVAAAGSTNNLSNDGILPPGAGSRNGTPLFADAAGKNFHLAAADTIACNQGADLTGDAYLYINDDIDGNIRGAYDGWDIGADELALQPTFTPSVSPTISPTPTQTPTRTTTPSLSASLPEPAQEIAYPNPARSGVVAFTSRPGTGERVTVRVFTMAYRQVWHATIAGVPGQINRMEWNISGMPPGIYLYQIETGSRKTPFKKLAIIK